MSKYSTELVIGMDMSDKTSKICILDAAGAVLKRDQVTNTIDGLQAFFSTFSDPSKVLIAMEAGTHSPWISCCLAEMGFKVLVGNSRKLRAIWASEIKTDDRDAEMLARIARMDINLFYPIRHRGKRSQSMLAVIKARDTLVKSRTMLINSVRGMLKSMGIAIPKCSTQSFAQKALETIPEEYHFGLLEMIDMIATLSEKIKIYDSKIKILCDKEFPETKIFSGITGVGPITSLAFILTIEDPRHFKKSRDIGPFLGLTPRREQSGEIDKQLGITKAGNELLRRSLVQCAQYILGHFGPDCDLRRFGDKIAARGGSAAKKKAIIAVARKLGVLMHQLWATGAEYDPFYNTNTKNRKEIKKAS
jgi:transposase